MFLVYLEGTPTNVLHKNHSTIWQMHFLAIDLASHVTLREVKSTQENACFLDSDILISGYYTLISGYGLSEPYP